MPLVPPTVADRRVLQVLRPAGAARPEVRLELWEGQRVVVKDYTVRATRTKLWIGKFLVAREYAAHRRLQGLPGIPPALPSGSPYVFARLYVEGRPAPTVPHRLTPAFFTQLTDLLRAIHRQAMSHGDLHRLENILVQPDGSPALVDFSAAIMSGSNPLAAVLLPYLQDDDWRGVAKLKQRHAPHLLTDADRRLLAERSLAERCWRWLRAYLRPWLQRRADALH
jgi:hypothetical protein